MESLSSPIISTYSFPISLAILKGKVQTRGHPKMTEEWKAMTDKSPINTLHVLMTKRDSPAPIYKFEELMDGNQKQFRCIAHAEGKTAIKVESSKKIAKNECAKALLSQFRNEGVVGIEALFRSILSLRESGSRSLNPKPTQKKPSESDKNTKPAKAKENNYVGELNEHASKQHLPLPTYQFVAELVKTGETILSCAFMGNLALGKAKNAKEAKQESAKNMLTLYVNQVDVASTSTTPTEDDTEQNIKLSTAPNDKDQETSSEVAGNDEKVGKNIGEVEMSLKDDVEEVADKFETITVEKEGGMVDMTSSSSSSGAVDILIDL